ncbi:polyphosphate kinase 2 family protein [Mucilaginibacter daejeonensis]|uniref:polyphosphate kinase 2 family protein n=1 Tax=Mucilaginibacter daejeonensis TaxID=398049 RepID=UPI001D174F6D|nr:polyphosphate kinase 2 family protein [Mucilaginibacter daejeonensis]UEG51944.1 polyphosphate kinase 2 family protein [Mucilaginibacter daejeonensis]
MQNITNNFKIKSNKKVSLKDIDTSYTGDYKKEEAEDLLADIIEKTEELQNVLYADGSRSLLIIFQAMDAAGKDGAIKHTLSGVNPQGCQVFSFKQPSAEEQKHDYLWRHSKALPEGGRIGVHNRSHYENVLVTRVHPEYILKENLPGISSVKDIDKKFWKDRFESIRHFEKHLVQNGTVIIKFFLHISKKEQKERFLKRINDPSKNWKFSAADIKEREHWDDYMEAYEEAISETATDEAPWYIIPADKKWFTRVAISSIIIDTLKSLDLKYPVLPDEEASKLQEAKAQLEAE